MSHKICYVNYMDGKYRQRTYGPPSSQLILSDEQTSKSENDL